MQFPKDSPSLGSVAMGPCLDLRQQVLDDLQKPQPIAEYVCMLLSYSGQEGLQGGSCHQIRADKPGSCS